MTSALSLQSSTTTIDRQQQSGLSQLPPETIIHVLVHSKIQDIAAFGSTCKYFREISLSNHLWSTLFERDFGHSNLTNWTRSILSWTSDNFVAYKAELSSRTCEYKIDKIQPSIDALKKAMAIEL